jgi:RNA polymerase-binding transcription factor DksA
MQEEPMQAKVTTPNSVRKTALEKRLVELGARLEAIEVELDSHQNRDWEELATEREGDEVLEATGNAGLTEITQIRAALKRIADGSYGECVQCGEKIAEARLDLLPWTPLCRSCAP